MPDTVFMKKCQPDPPPPPPPPLTPCELQKLKQKRAHLKKCEKPLCPEPPPPKVCKQPDNCLCIERVKHPVALTCKELANQQVICVVERQLPGIDRCKKIYDKTLMHPDLPWPGCPVPPPPPPPPVRDPCEEMARRARIALCKERMKRYEE